MLIVLIVLTFVLVPFVPLIIFQMMDDGLLGRIEEIEERRRMERIYELKEKQRKHLTRHDICGRI